MNDTFTSKWMNPETLRQGTDVTDKRSTAIPEKPKQLTDEADKRSTTLPEKPNQGTDEADKSPSVSNVSEQPEQTSVETTVGFPIRNGAIRTYTGTRTNTGKRVTFNYIHRADGEHTYAFYCINGQPRLIELTMSNEELNNLAALIAAEMEASA